ncbi:thiolase family protein [Rhodococcus sp. 14C212]|uniref:thiolase family protein n=1 Tax=Rhodococcus sp. 14C212 TaxID=2711209 RepID=UPI0013EC7DE4|nr:thiolase family protein [Rhodococcus sp. 14C212]NGP08673.1 thiolase family protein [Rhodococcus sp. 14C212]
MTTKGRQAAVVGVGYSDLFRHGDPDPRRLAVQASRAALDDAGLGAADIDGMFHFRFDGDISVHQIQTELGIPDLAVYSDTMVFGPSGLASVMEAAMAVESGACEVAMAIRCITRKTGHVGALSTDDAPAPGTYQYLAPFGWGNVITGMALRKQRRMAEFGGGGEEYALVALNARKWASQNERAVLREEITSEQYWSARPVADPLLVLDCDYPVNGAVVTIITTAERAADLRQRPVYIDSYTYASGRNPDAPWAFGEDFLYTSTRACADRLWSRTSLTREDVDVAQIYDGFTHITVSWIEALGFCGIGEFASWADGGKTIGPGGALPMNTSGGHLAEGRVHGIQFVTEAVLQLRGECGVRQVQDANVSVVTNAFGSQTGAMLLRT